MTGPLAELDVISTAGRNLVFLFAVNRERGIHHLVDHRARSGRLGEFSDICDLQRRRACGQFAAGGADIQREIVAAKNPGAGGRTGCGGAVESVISGGVELSRFFGLSRALSTAGLSGSSADPLQEGLVGGAFGKELHVKLLLRDEAFVDQ